MSCIPDDIMESIISCVSAKETWTDLVHSFKGPLDTKENRIMDLKLEYQTFRAKSTKSLSKTYTCYKTLLNELANDGVNFSKHGSNVGFVDNIFGRFVYKENLIQRRYFDTKKALITTPSSSTISNAFFSNNAIQDFQDNFDDEVDERSSEEYLRELHVEYRERSLLENSKRFIKRRNSFSVNNFSLVSKGFRSKLTPKLIQSSPNSNSQTNPKFQKDYKAEYKKKKAKLALLEASPSSPQNPKTLQPKNNGLVAEIFDWDKEEVSDDEEVTQVKVLMVLADDELTVGKSHARNGEWVDITKRKGASPSSEDSSNKSVSGTVTISETKQITPLVPTEVKETEQESKLNELTKLSQMLIDEKVNSDQETQESTSKSLRPKPIQKPQLKCELYHYTNHSTDDCYRILYCMICKREDHRTSDHKMYIASFKRSKGYKAQPYQYASTSKKILKAMVKLFPPCTHYGFNDHRPDDYRNYHECEIYGSYDHSTSGHNPLYTPPLTIMSLITSKEVRKFRPQRLGSPPKSRFTKETNPTLLFVQRDIKEPIWKKSQTPEMIMSFIKIVENRNDVKVKQTRTDNGTEFRNHKLESFYDENGISQNSSSPYTPKQNGVAERKNRTLIKAARTMLNGLVLSKHFWTEEVKIGCYTQNISIIVKRHDKTSYEIFKERIPSISYFNVFKCHVFIHNHKDHLGKFNAKADDEYFLGYSSVSKAFRVYNTKRQQIEETYHVTFDESMKAIKFTNTSDDQMITHPTDVPSGNNTEVSRPITEPLVPDITQSHIPNQASTSSHLATQDRLPIDQHIKLVNIIANPREGMLTRSMAAKLTTASTSECLFAYFLSDIEPKKEERIDYDETFAPVARMEAIRIFLAFATYINFKVYQMDVKSTFLNGKLKEGVYVKQPPCFESNEFPDYVCKLDKALYGLKQALRACSLMKTPMVPPNNLGPDLSGKPVNKTSYRGMIGSLMYLTTTRHDIQFSIVLCARYQSNPKESHLIVVKRIFRYSKDTPTLGLYYPKCLGFDLKGYSDLDYAGCNMDRKSTLAKAKYVAAAGCCVSILWIKSQLSDYDIHYKMVPIFCDNTSAITISNNTTNNVVGNFNYPPNMPAYKPIMKFLQNFPLYYAFTNCPSVVYQNFLREFWSNDVAFDHFPSIDEPEKRPLKEFIKFSVLNGQRPLTLDFNTFCSSSGLNYNNGKYFDHPTPEVLSENYSSTEKVNSIQQLLSYSLITGTEVDIWEIIYSDLVTMILNKSRLKYISYPRFISCALQVLLGPDYNQDKKFGFLPLILNNSNFTKDPSKVTEIELTAYMIVMNNQRDLVSPSPLVAKPKKGKSQTVTSTSPKSQGPEASGVLSKKSKSPMSKKPPTKTKVTPPKPTKISEQSHLVSSGTVPNTQDLKRDIQLACKGLPFTLDEGTRKSQPLLERSCGEKDSGETNYPLIWNHKTPLMLISQGLVLNTRRTRTSPLFEYQSSPPQEDKHTLSTAPQTEASDTYSSSDKILKKYDDTFPLTKRQLVKYLRKVSHVLFERIIEDQWEKHEEAVVHYVNLKASIDDYYNENIAHRDQTDQLVEASMSYLKKSSSTINNLYKGLEVITQLLKDITNFVKDDPSTNKKIKEASETLMYNAFRGQSSSAPSSCDTSTFADTLVNVNGENATHTATKEPLSHTEEETDANMQDKPKEPKEGKGIATDNQAEDQRNLVKASSIVYLDPDEPVRVEFMINRKIVYVTKQEFQGYWDKEEEIKKAKEEARLNDIRKIKVIKVVHEEAKKLGIHLKEAITTKAGDLFKKVHKAEHEVLKRQHTKKVRKSLEVRKHKYDSYVWTVSSRPKPEHIIDIKIYPKTKPLVITVYKGIDGRNFDVHKPFLFRAFGIYKLDKLREIIPKNKNTLVKHLMNSLSQRYERLRQIPRELGNQSALPAPEQAPSQTLGRKRKHMELDPETRIPGLECNRTLPENVPFVNNMVIKEPEYGIFFTDDSA
uniref:Retrovirus-related Pol polyprotein from transposon TNT 1-94 n=1 Tax=Tanacetum cinerariifolium TaxID=118510 RepID=A0A699GL19_TANCI|nr:retrovirus-related Pol polyprotein from transposon TNT 1-94 [Tanacetum cinerariifolium]GEU71315.1 retrovirus-related Pol polyprotein from transposon TNT 1-94 [Tanacetum cinerariifolium]